MNERTEQPFYSPIYNYIEAKNNDGANELNNATFSTELVVQLLNIYATRGRDTVVYDSFMGTGTTALGAKMLKMNCYGSEISKEQCDFANKRLLNPIVPQITQNDYRKIDLI